MRSAKSASSAAPVHGSSTSSSCCCSCRAPRGDERADGSGCDHVLPAAPTCSVDLQRTPPK
eukprot:4141425-Prymnesium_polylepis.1